MKSEIVTRPGRPRDLSKDQAVLVATRRLLAEVGYQQSTIAAIARMAGVNTPAIYRRWPTREALIEEAVHGTGGHPMPEESGDLRTDLATWVRIFLARAASPAARAGVPGLLADSQSAEARQRLLVIGAPVRQAFRDLLDGAAARGEIAGGVDAMFLFDLLSGATTMRGLTRGAEDEDSFVEALAGSLFVVAAHTSETNPSTTQSAPARDKKTVDT